MLSIRMQRTGRKGHAQFRVVVQDSRVNPSSGRVVATLGSYNPHNKTAQLDKEKALTYLNNGAQPSERVAKLLQTEGVELPKWFSLSEPNARAIRNPEKLRRNRPAEEPVAEESAETSTDASEETAVEAEAPAPDETSAESAAVEEAPVEPAAE